MKQWTLSQNSFDQFLMVLDPNRDRAGQKYEALRNRIVKFFEWRACRFADDLADEAFDRVIRKVAVGENIEDLTKYMYGVARLVYLENAKQQGREQAIIYDFPTQTVAPEDEDDTRLDCLELCLKKLSDENRSLILHYYRDEKQAKIDSRRRLADLLGISVNALRIKALRIRAKVEECVLGCMKGTE